MTEYLNAEIQPNGPVSEECIRRHLYSFGQAAAYVRQLPYGRNADKNSILCVFTDNCGTCSTKHALLKRLADENQIGNLKLMLGMFHMNKNNSPQIAATLALHHLESIPEAHCYLKYKGQRIDFTKVNFNPLAVVEDLIEEIEIAPEQITDFKNNYHQNHLKTWLQAQPQIQLSFAALWKVREQCIQDLSEE
jgi:hypothetical protein